MDLKSERIKNIVEISLICLIPGAKMISKLLNTIKNKKKILKGLKKYPKILSSLDNLILPIVLVLESIIPLKETQNKVFSINPAREVTSIFLGIFVKNKKHYRAEHSMKRMRSLTQSRRAHRRGSSGICKWK